MVKYNLGSVQQGVAKVELLNHPISSIGAHDINDSVKNYKFILVTGKLGNTKNINQMSTLINTDIINTTSGVNAWLIYLSDSAYVGFNFINGFNKITINEVGNINCEIISIIGIN